MEGKTGNLDKILDRLHVETRLQIIMKHRIMKTANYFFIMEYVLVNLFEAMRLRLK
jgi:hypothetical protein